MTAPGPQPPAHPKRRRTNAIILSVTALLVLCCGGVTAVNALTGDDKPAAAEQPAAPRQVAPFTTTPQPTEAATTRPAPTKPKLKPSPSRKPAPKPKPTTRKPKPRPTATKAAVRQGVHPGAFCAPAGARGVSKKGKAMVCTSTTSDDRNRWRAA